MGCSVNPFRIAYPDGEALPVVASVPHAGTSLPEGYAARFASDAMRALPMTDWYVDRLFDFLPALGVTLIAAEWSRFVIDLNRPPDGEALYPGRYETGLVPLENFDGEAVFAEPPSREQIARARREIYEPYHRKLDELLAQAARGGRAVLFDLHSVTPRANRISGPLPCEIMLGDRDGRSCGAWLTALVERAYAAAGFSVVRNDPYKGGWITERSGRRSGVEALQIEMNWAVYLEGLDSPPPRGARFSSARARLRAVFEGLLPLASERLARS